MTEHWIRLRGGWEWSDAQPPGARSRRVTLPVDRRAGFAGAVRLARWFHAPPVDFGSEAVLLHLNDVDGLRGVWLNDRQIAGPHEHAQPLILALEDLLATRNRLVLEAQLPPRGSDAAASEPWGAVALVIRGRADVPPPE